MALRARIALAVVSCVQISVAAESHVIHIHNFAAVNDHIYRGAEPSPLALEELGALGVKLVIDLRENSGVTRAEQEHVRKLGMAYVNVPLNGFAAPTQAQMQSVLALLAHNDSQRIFVHCRRGKDRIGTVIACYRIEHDGWNNKKALEEARSHGMSSLQRAMQAYIAHFSPIALAPLVAAGN